MTTDTSLQLTPEPDLAPPVYTERGIDFLNSLLASEYAPPPFAITADIRPTLFEKGRAVFEGRPSRRFYNPSGSVHGGWLAALLDTSMASAVHTTLGVGQVYTTIELKTVFVKAVTDETGVLVCEGKLIHAGKRIAHAEGKIHDAQGRLIAYGSESCLISNVSLPLPVADVATNTGTNPSTGNSGLGDGES